MIEIVLQHIQEILILNLTIILLILYLEIFILALLIIK